MNLFKGTPLSDQDLNTNLSNSRALPPSLTMRAQGTRRGRQPVSTEERSHLRRMLTSHCGGGWALSGWITGYYCQSSPQRQFPEV